MHKRSFSSEERKKIIKLLDQLPGCESNKDAVTAIHFNFKNSTNSAASLLRDTFDAATKMFFNNDKCKELIEMMRIQIANMTMLKIEKKHPYIHADIIAANFTQGNLKLVNDIWYPILDVVPRNFIIENKDWGNAFLDATNVILSYYISLKMDLNGDAYAKTRALKHGDKFTIGLGIPLVRRPATWSKNMDNVSILLTIRDMKLKF